MAERHNHIHAAEHTGTVDPLNLHNVTLSGNTAGVMAQISTGTMTLAGGNNITLSQAGNAVTISGPNAGGAQTGISSISVTDTEYTSGRVVFTGTNLVTVKSSAAGQTVILDATNQNLSAGVSTGGNTAGDTGVATGSRLVFSGQGQVTLSQATGAGASTVGISVPNSHAQQTGISGISVTDTNYTSGTVRITGSGLVTVQSSAANQTVIINATNQNLSAGVSTGGNTSGDTTVNTGSRLVIVGSNNITASQGTAAGATTVTLSGANTHAQQTGVSALYDGANSISSGTVRLTNANNITFTINGQTLSGSVHAPETPLSVGVSTGGNTAGDTGVATGSRLVFSGQDNITLSQVTGAGATTIGIKGGAGGGGGSFSGGVSNLGNTAGSTGITGTRLVFVGTGDISLSQATDANGGTITINDGPVLSGFHNASFQQANDPIAASGALGARTWKIAPLNGGHPFPGVLTANTAYIRLSLSGSTATMSSNYTTTFMLALYTRNVSTLSLLNSVSTTFGYAGAATNNSTGFVGNRYWSIHSSLWSAEPVLTRGEYWLGVWYSTGGQSFQTFSIWGGYANLRQANATHSGTAGVATVASATSQGMYPFGAGEYSVTSASPPASIGSNELIRSASSQVFVPYVLLLREGPQTF